MKQVTTPSKTPKYSMVSTNITGDKGDGMKTNMGCCTKSMGKSKKASKKSMMRGMY